MCTVLSPVTSPAVSVLQVPAAVIPSVQLMPAAALGLPVTPVFIAGDVAIGPPSFFMVPNWPVDRSTDPRFVSYSESH